MRPTADEELSSPYIEEFRYAPLFSWLLPYDFDHLDALLVISASMLDL